MLNQLVSTYFPAILIILIQLNAFGQSNGNIKPDVQAPTPRFSSWSHQSVFVPKSTSKINFKYLNDSLIIITHRIKGVSYGINRFFNLDQNGIIRRLDTLSFKDPSLKYAVNQFHLFRPMDTIIYSFSPFKNININASPLEPKNWGLWNRISNPFPKYNFLEPEFFGKLPQRFPGSFRADSILHPGNFSEFLKPENIDQWADNEFRRIDAAGEIDKITKSSRSLDEIYAAAAELRSISVRESLKNKNVLQQVLKNPEKGGSNLPEVWGKRFQSAQNKIAGLKKKYSRFSSASDIENSMKRNSMKGVPFQNRLTPGGELSLRRIHPILLEIEPVLGYRVNKNFSAGFSGRYEIEEKLKTNAKSRIGRNNYGSGLFASHTLFKGYFGYFELGRTSAESDKADLNGDWEWKNNLETGLGREIPIKNGVKGIIMIVYDALPDRSQNLTRPWKIKTGIWFK